MPVHPQRARHLGVDRRDPLYRRGTHFSIGHPVSAQPHPVAYHQAGQCIRVQRHGLLTHDPDQPARRVDRRDRPDHRVLDDRRHRREPAVVRTGMHHHHLAHRQVTGRNGLPAALQVRCGVDIDLQAVDADAGEAGDHTHNAGASQSRCLRDGTGAADAARLSLCLSGWWARRLPVQAGASDTARVPGRHVTGPAQTRRLQVGIHGQGAGTDRQGWC
ncbi:MAG: hypothetical protein MUF55_08055 [Hydrogenophaga sp.]|nr:hypothetical protein [Hydrogenophaga sp.]